jgi:hypothetical protein
LFSLQIRTGAKHSIEEAAGPPIVACASPRNDRRVKRRHTGERENDGSDLAK